MKKSVDIDGSLSLIAEELGHRIRAARKRRNIKVKDIVERSGLSRQTVYNIERGFPGVNLGYYLKVLQVLRLEKDINLLAADSRMRDLIERQNTEKGRRG